MSEAKILDTIRKWTYHWMVNEPGYEDRARLCDANMAHHLCRLLLDEAKLGDVSELQDKVDELKAEVASHARYRELVKSDLAEKSWKKDNDRLRVENEDLKQSNEALLKKSDLYHADIYITHLEAEVLAFKEFVESIRAGTAKGGVFYREEALFKLGNALNELEQEND